jgi:hypothetical protein
MVSGFWQVSLAGQGLSVQAGGNNVPERYTSDLWVLGHVAYTGTWGGAARRDDRGNLNAGNVIKIWRLDGGGGPLLDAQVTVPGAQTVSDVEVSRDGRMLVVTLERGVAAGFVAYSLVDPFAPAVVASQTVPGGLHTGTLGVVGNRTFLLAAKNPAEPALMIWDVTSVLP